MVRIQYKFLSLCSPWGKILVQMTKTTKILVENYLA